MATFLAAMAKHFGPKGDSPGRKPDGSMQNLKDFSDELKTLSFTDKMWYYNELVKIGDDVEAPKDLTAPTA